jgi:hypothetical protein
MLSLCRPFLAIAFATAVVSGQIRDRTTNQPMPGLHVALGAHRTRTDRDGRYTVKGVAARSATLVVQSKDVPAQRFSITVKSPSMRFDVHVCSMTLDYSCSSLNGSPNSD